MKTKQIFLLIVVILTLIQLVACVPFTTKPVPPVSTPTATASAETRLNEARMLMQQDKCAEAMPILNALIEERPDWNLPYEDRYSCNISFQSNVLTVQQGYYLAALQDLNTLIQLDPTSGGYRAWRDYALRQIATLERYSADKFAIYDLANQDAVKAIELGVVPSSFVYRHYARNLIEGNHCQEGLAEIQKLIDKTTMQSMEFGQYYSLYETEAYICLGELDKALESAQYITCDDPATTCRTGLIALIHFQSGDYEKTLETVNNMINLQSAGGGWRYFIRALIEYEMGEKDKALQDLEFGAGNIWHEDGVYWYVKAKLAIDAGDKETGIQYLQTAEQTLGVTYTPFRQKVIDELKTYGVEPIMREPDLPFAPLPTP